MNYYGSKDLAGSFRTVRKNTLIIADEIGEDHYGFRAAPDTRTVGQTLTHIALTSKLQQQVHGVEKRTTLEGFDFPKFMAGMMADEAAPRTKAQIIELLHEEGDQFANWVEGL